MSIRVTPSDLVTSASRAPHGPYGTAVVDRFAAPARGPAFWAVLWAGALAAELVVIAGIALAEEPVPGYRAVFRITGGVYLACGLVAWRRRPDSRSGILMVATGVGLLIEPIVSQIGTQGALTVGDLLEDVWAIPIIALLLTFLTGGRLDSRVDRVLVGVFVLAFAIEIARHLVLPRDGNFLLVRPDSALADGFLAAEGLVVSVGCLAVAGVIAARWVRASAPRRRAMVPSVAGIACLLLFAVAQQAAPMPLKWLAVCSLLAIPAGFLGGLLRSRLARGGLMELFRDLDGMDGAALQARLGKALGDPGLVLAQRVPGRQAYADAAGEPVRLPKAGDHRAIAPIERDGREVAALLYDRALDDDPELVEAVRAAATLALENARLQAEAESRLAELRASRQRLVAAGDAERRRLERDLHDGAQQRLVALALQLRLIQADIRRDPAMAERMVTSASDELAESLKELRELARGIHPAALDHGLASALESLAARSTVATAVECDVPEGLPGAVELAVYFVACEALANVGKYARASAASVRLSRTAAGVAIEIADDGVGGAASANGSGLRGLADRIEALDGRLLVTSPQGAGTVVTAELPCAR